MRPYWLKFIGILAISLLLSTYQSEMEASDGWIQLFNGTSMAHWKINENPESWRIEDRAFVANGRRSHIFYLGPDTPFVDFELHLEVFTEPGSNGGVYFLTQYQASGWPETGFEAQVNNSYFIDPKKTGSLYGIDNVWLFSPASDKEWFSYTILVQGNKISLAVKGKVVTEHKVEVRPEAGTIALQAHDRRSMVKYRNIRLRKLD